MERIFGILSNIVNQIFFPIEHIAWAADKGLLSVTAAPWWFASLLTWITSLLINILRYEFNIYNMILFTKWLFLLTRANEDFVYFITSSRSRDRG